MYDIVLMLFYYLSHENANGFYSTGAYFAAKIVMDLIPFRILTVLLYCPIAYFITGKYEQLTQDIFPRFYMHISQVSVQEQIDSSSTLLP